jgi:hypothetical protein
MMSCRDHASIDEHDVLCFECYRLKRERRPVGPVGGATHDPGLELTRPFGKHLSAQQVAHRRRMLAHLRTGHGRRLQDGSQDVVRRA